jgi:beta-phosphoglucomutase
MRAVLFDMDGVLVDSYEAHLESWRILAAEQGLPLAEADFGRTFGRVSREVIVELWPQRAGEAAAFDARKEWCFRHLIDQRFPAIEGAADLVRALHGAGWKLAVASSGPPENVELVLSRLGAGECFEAVVTGRDVARGKPDPEVFVTAAARLGVPATRCVVIEDAPLGVAAAHAGGMQAIALLSTGRQAADFRDERPELMVSSLADLDPERLARLLR